MSFSESEFKPKVKKTGSDATVRIIDPNPLQEIVPLEDLFIYVSLRAKQKSKSILTETEGPKLKLINENRSSIDLITPQRTQTVDGTNLFSSKPMLTTDWTEIGGHNFSATKVGDNGKDFEGFGITNIDIEIKSQQTPKFVINFTDVRGATLFEQGSCSPYGLFFNLPYPMFELTVKGYYGKPVNYYLNLTKFNTKFNSETGNMDCTAEFIGYTFAFLSDIIVGYVAASQELPKEKYDPQGKLRSKYRATKDYYVKNGLTYYNDTGTDGPWCDNPAIGSNPPKCTTISDLVQQLKRFETVEKPNIGGSNENIELEALTKLVDFYTTYKESVTSLARTLENKGVKIEPSKSNKRGTPKKARFIFDDQKLLDELTKSPTGDLYLTFNNTNGYFVNSIKNIKTVEINKTQKGGDILGSNSVLTTLSANDLGGNGPFPKIYDILKDKDWHYKVLTATEIVQPDYDVPLMLQNLQKPYLDLGFILDDIDNEIELLNGENGIVTQKRKTLIDAVNSIIETTLGFKPTIRNVFSVLLCNTDAFMEILLEVYGKAQTYHSEQQYDKLITVGNENEILASGGNKPVVYPWPTYFKKNHFSETSAVAQGTREVYPGVDFPNWWEVIFVEDFIKAYMKFVNKQEIINGDVQGKPGYDNYVPVSTIESRLINIAQEPLKYYEKTLPDILTIIGERLFISLDHTLFQPMRLTEDITKLPLGENWNLLKTANVNKSANTVKTLANIDSFNLINTLEGTEGRKILSAFQNYKESDFIKGIIDQLKKTYPGSFDSYTSTYSSTNAESTMKYKPKTAAEISKYGYIVGSLIYKFTPKTSDGLIGLEVYNRPGTVIRPNPHNMSTDLLFSITTEEEVTSKGIKQIDIYDEDFIGQIKQLGNDIEEFTKDITYKTKGYNPDEDIFKAKLTTTTNANTNYAGNSGGGNKNVRSGHFLPSFDGHKLFTTLYMSVAETFGDDKRGDETAWFEKGGDITLLPASTMGSISYWFPGTETFGVSLLQDGPNEYKRIFNKSSSSFDGDNYPSLKDESIDKQENIEPADDVSGDGISTPIITTPFWMDNVNSFRIAALGPGAVLKNYDLTTNLRGEDSDNKIQNRNLAYIFLHTLKTTPFISRYITQQGNLTETPTIQSLRALMLVGGVSKVPKAWLLTLGAQLWRWKMFVGTKTVSDKEVWNKPLTCIKCLAGDKPTGFDPLAQPGYNSWHRTNGYVSRTYKGYDQSGTGVMERNHLPTYLNKIYEFTFDDTVKKIQSSVFTPEHQGVSDVYTNGSLTSKSPAQTIGSLIGTDGNTKHYYNAFRYANINRLKMGKLETGLRTNDDGGNFGDNLGPLITIEGETKKYSWSQNWVAPHHLMFVNPEKFYDVTINKEGEGSGFILTFETNVGLLDYPTIMSENINGNVYDDNTTLSANTGNAKRSKKFDGNLGMIFQYIPDEIKNKIVKNFEDWVDGDNGFAKSILPVIDPINFNTFDNVTITTTSYEYNEKISKTLLGNKGDSTYLTLKENDDTIKSIKKQLLQDEYWLINSTPKIWYGIGTKDQPDAVNKSNQFVDAFLVTKTQFDLYLKTFLSNLKTQATKKIKEIDEEEVEKNKDNNNMSIMDDTDTKLALYRTFKSISDKWISASKKQSDASKPSLFFNLIENGDGTTCKGQSGTYKNKMQDGSSNGAGPRPTLASHFQYVNRVMGDIGDEAVIDISKLSELTENPKISLYQYLVDVLVENNYLFFPLPAFVNFTGNGLADNDLVDMFRPVNSLKSISCGPLFLSMYVGGSSRQLSMVPNTTCGLDQEALNNIQDDSFTISKQEIDPARQPKDTTDPKAVNSDGFTAFKVVYGLDTQNHFKSIQLDQSEFSETAESLLVIEKLSQQGGGDQSSKGQNLNAMYLTRSYSCTVESLGNMMIQPMSYFDLIGVPMFSGAYLITEVKHSFTPNNAKTTFKGVRQPRMTTPIVTDAAVAMNITFKNNTATGKSIGGVRSGGSSGANSASLQGIAYTPIKIGNITVKQMNPFLNESVQAFKAGYPEWVVLHWSGGWSFAGEIATLKSRGLHYHLTVDTDGTLNQISDLNKVAWHAGCPDTKTGPCHSMNHKSIGISYIGGTEKAKKNGNGDLVGYVRTEEEWNQEDLNYGNDNTKSWYSDECSNISNCKGTTFKAKAQFESIINAILLAKSTHPTIRGITSHHLTCSDKGDVGDKFPWARLFKEIKERTTKMGTPWEPIFGDKFYDTEGKYVGELVREFGDPNFVSSDVEALSEYNQYAGVQIPANSQSVTEIYTKLNDKIQNPNLVWGIMGNMQNESSLTSNVAGDNRPDQSTKALKVEGSGVFNSFKKEASGFYCSYGYTQLNVCGGGGANFLKYNNLENASDLEKIKALTDSNKHLEWVIKWVGEHSDFGNGSLPVTKQDSIDNWTKKFAAEYERCDLSKAKPPKGKCVDGNSIEVQDRIKNAINLSKSNISIALPPSTKPTKTVVIGDSQSPAIATKANKTFLSAENKGWKVGWSMKDLATALNSNTEDDTVLNIVISIGTNGVFGGNNGLGDSSQLQPLINGLKKSYPFAKNIFLVKGSWGWSQYNKFCLTGSEQTQCPRVETYYTNLNFGLTMAGYKSTIIPTAIGYTQNHPDGSTASYTTIGNEINSSIP